MEVPGKLRESLEEQNQIAKYLERDSSGHYRVRFKDSLEDEDNFYDSDGTMTAAYASYLEKEGLTDPMEINQNDEEEDEI